jgi:2-dehydro-3-deoxyphosphooctonate aldolase (KDO 8-P synthase)
MNKLVKIGNVEMANNKPFVLIAGPCQMESREHAFMVCGQLVEITKKLGIPFIYKSSFDKANRTSLKGKRGFGIENSLPVFADIKKEFGIPVLTDVHEREQCDEVASVVDVIQVPAFLCRQTDFLLACGEAAKKYNGMVNIKKGQFLAPWDMKNVAEKVASTGCDKISLTDRGASFGYNTLVTDIRALPIMAETGYPVVIDATHSVQQPGGQGNSSGGNRDMVPYISRAAVAAGVAAVFAETHQDPDNAPSDGPCMVKLNDMEGLLSQLKAIDSIVKK